MKGNHGESPLSSDLMEYEIFDDDVDRLRHAISEPNQTNFIQWVEPEDLKLKHRIGRGPFGDVWIATLHSSTEEFDEFHEVAVKMLSFVSEECIEALLERCNVLLKNCQSLIHVGWPRGITKKNGKACIIMKLYESSVGDKMALLKGSKLPLEDVLRYGVEIVQGVMELHSLGIFALNLKPCNFLIDDQDEAVLGDFGIPMLIFGSSLSTNEKELWLGTPRYMAPEQWSPDLRGPISFETDSWGFACSILEMLTGTRPWDQKSNEEIFTSVVVNQEKPRIPTGLPSALAKVLRGCFEYDYRQRPTFDEILCALKSPEMLFNEGDWVYSKEKSEWKLGKVGVVKTVVAPEAVLLQYPGKKNELVNCSGLHKLSHWREAFREGDLVKLKDYLLDKDPSGLQELFRTEGTVAGEDKASATVLVRFSESQELVKLDPVVLERVSSGFVAGDWFRFRQVWILDATKSSRKHSSMGIVHYIEHDGKVKVAVLGCETLLAVNPSYLEKIKPFHVGQFIRLRDEIRSPRFQWPLKKSRCWDTGKILKIMPNGTLIVIFPGHLWNHDEWLADPEEVEIVRLQDCSSLISKYQYLESMHWSVRPVVFMVGLLASLKVGAAIVHLFPGSSRLQKRVAAESSEEQFQLQLVDSQKSEESHNSTSPSWRSSPVVNMWFKDGTIHHNECQLP